MSIPWVLRDDLYRLPANELALRFRCGACYVCELRDACRSGLVSFKETALFEYLDILSDDFGVERIVYLERPRQQVVESYGKHELWYRWQLADRRLARESLSLATDMDTATMSRAYGEVATDLKHAYWRRHAPRFFVMNVSFKDLALHPADTVRAVLDFLGRKPLPYLEVLIRRKFQEGEAGHVYATFPNDHR